jgi:uncharacterized membrane protein YphA (DoxX/SURF4 family)
MRRTEIISCLVIFLFVYAAMSKLMEFEKFVIQLKQSPLLSPVATFIAISVPIVEVALVVLLILPVTRLTGLYCSFVLMALFTAYIFIVSRLSNHVPCSCGGVLEKLSWNEHLIFNVVFMMLMAAGIVFHPPRKALSETSE